MNQVIPDEVLQAAHLLLPTKLGSSWQRHAVVHKLRHVVDRKVERR